MASSKGCSLTLAMYWELFGEKEAASYYYPINTLRNYAALMVGNISQRPSDYLK
jgi:hypothetical protein